MVMLLYMFWASLEFGHGLAMPDGILISGLGPNQATFEFQPGDISLTIPFLYRNLKSFY